jgi:hypothetical protein
VGVIVTGMTAWGAGAIYYSPLPGQILRAILAGFFVLATALAFLLLPKRRWTLLGFFVVFATLVALFFQIPASNDRDWQTEVSVTPYATINGDLVTIHGVRNFDYRTETDFDPHWEDRTYDLRKLDSVDIIAVYWAGKAIAHIMVGFGFQGKDFLAVSIETRKEKGEEYSTLAGFFRHYELVYIAADERDVIRVRTNYRQPQEDVYIYRTRAPIRNIPRFFLDYVQTMNDMHKRARFYNTLTTNCTTSILMHTRMNPESPPISWKILLSGYVPDYLYGLGRIDTTKSFTELEKLSHVNARAHAADKDPEFSQRIREGLPKPSPLP